MAIPIPPGRSRSPPLNAMTIDVEDYFQVAALAGAIAAEDWERWPRRVEVNTRRLLDLVERHGVRATCFVLGWIAERHPTLVREIAARGHEIACHGYSHQLVYHQTPARFREETRRARVLLEDQVQRPVAGYRAASYSITPASRWALDILVEEGFRYDSSIFPIRHDRYGMPGSPRYPHRLTTPAGGEIVEFPLTTWRVLGQSVPVAGGGYFRLLPYPLIARGLRAAAAGGQPTVFYLHPWELDPEQPRVPGLPWRSRLRHYRNLHRTGERLERLLGEMAFAPMGDVLAATGLLTEAGGAPCRASA